MPITLGDITFDAANSAAKETHEEVGGRRERVIELSGLLVGLSSAVAIHDALDAVLAAASTEDYSAELSLRSGRRLFVRRAEFVRNVNAEALTGAFTLKLAAKDPFEESTSLHTVSWPITMSGATQSLNTAGTASAKPIIRLTAQGATVNPALSDGSNAMTYAGSLEPGDVLVLDGRAGMVTLNGTDVTPYVSGTFPEISPAGSIFTYTDAPTSSHMGSVAIEYRDRWW